MRNYVDALRDLRLHPGRSAIAGLSLFVGVLAIIATVVAGTITQEIFLAAAEQRTAKDTTYAQDLPVSTINPDVPRFLSTLADQYNLHAMEGAWALLCEPSQTQIGIQPGRTSLQFMPAQFTLTAGELPRVKRLPVVSGHWLDDRNPVYPIEAVVNLEAARRFGGVGNEIAVLASPQEGPLTVRIVGVVSDGRTAPTVFLSLTSVVTLRPTLVVSGQTLLVHGRPSGDAAIRRVIGSMSKAIAPEAEISPQRFDSTPSITQQLERTQLIFRSIALVALVLSLLGMMSIGVATVNERARELVVRRAVGARRRDIFLLVLYGSFIIGVLAAIAAIGVGATVTYWVGLNAIDVETAIRQPDFPWPAAVWGAVAAVGTTLLAGALPALRAARLDIATVLRD
ncbi:MAG TPA: ABC transporter permease [Micromonospora sp.]|nr:ABC transporter permease [Micromonospora sp.]